MPRRVYRPLKRLADILFAAAVLVVLSPVLAVVALIIRLTSRGPVLYRAPRVGENGRDFMMLKFRTMVDRADQLGPSITAGDDPRITPIGRLLRRTKIDEIPQFWSVLIGDMSVVGPRPQLRSYTDRYDDEAKLLLSVPQGITDFSSLWFRRQEVLLEGTGDVEKDYDRLVAPTKIRLGLYYAEHATLWADFKIVIATAGAILLRIDPLWCFPRAIRTPHDMVKVAQPTNL